MHHMFELILFFNLTDSTYQRKVRSDKKQKLMIILFIDSFTQSSFILIIYCKIY